ncbi:hypothetical protein GGX14DRAFT_391048 [Mycena pura]|uniref:Uncharacterized protein n=1 Tax=Mycena pura TaxID=153505 RepID=A0AAD6YFM7_9AGAR|nr:hypothetical protein GGX14DRAFT_391048 [Mycena pura]
MPPALASSSKAQKKTNGIFRVARPDQPSPANRKTPLRIYTGPPLPPDAQSPRQNDPTYSPTPGANVPLPSATPSLASTSPTTSAPDSPTMDVDNQTQTAANTAQGQQPPLSHPPAPQQHPALQPPPPQQPPPPPPPPPPQDEEQQQQMIIPALIWYAQPPPTVPLPSHFEFMTRIAVGRDDNPHFGIQRARPAPPLLPDGAAPYQRNPGTWPEVVVPLDRLLEGIKKSMADSIVTSRSVILLILPFLSGQRFFNVHPNAATEAHRALSSVVNPDEVVLARPQPEVVQTGGWSEKYRAPFPIVARFANVEARSRVLARGPTFVVNKTLAFHALPVDPSIQTWVLGLWKPMGTTASPAVLTQECCAAAFIEVATNPDIVHHIAQTTQGVLTGTAEDRALSVARTIDGLYHPHPTDPIIVLFARPYTTDNIALEGFRALIRPLALTYEMTSFTPASPHAHPECVVCKLDTHPAYLCPFTAGSRAQSETTAAAATTAAPAPEWRTGPATDAVEEEPGEGDTNAEVATNAGDAIADAEPAAKR